MLGNKTLRSSDGSDLQSYNRDWWSHNPMTYDWHGTNAAKDGTPEFFREIDRRFFTASPFFVGTPPFSDLIPYPKLKGKRVLEIGCGQGSHTQLLVEAGCDLTAVDITPAAVNRTLRRLSLAGLAADVREMDAERLQFASSEFDFVWSWGVIHHSASTENILREVARVTKGSGEFRFMVYNRNALDSYLKIVRGLCSLMPLRGMSVDEILSHYTDGYLARFYTRKGLRLLLQQNNLELSDLRVMGQTSELVPLPGIGLSGRIKSYLVRHFPQGAAASLLSATGSFLFATARPVA